MKNTLLVIILLIIVLVGGWYLVRDRKMADLTNTATTTDSTIVDTSDVIPTNNGTIATSTGTSTQQSTDIVVTSPHSGDLIKSPITVTGKAKGSWYFEASAPVKVYDSAGKLLGSSIIQAQGEWMTTDFVAFAGTINLTATTTQSTGTIVFMNDNPSGDPARNKTYTLPIRFK